MSSLRNRSLVLVLLVLLLAAAVLAHAAPARAVEPVSFAPYEVVPAGVDGMSVGVGDFNGDGKADLVVPNLYGFDVSILLGDGHGGFSAPTDFAAGGAPNAVATGDFNRDGKLDVVTANSWNDVTVLLGDGSGGFSAPAHYATDLDSFAVAVADFNGDGIADLVTANHNANDVSVLLGDGSGGFGVPANFAVDSTPCSVAVGDFNGDGHVDLVASNQSADDVSVLLGNGDGTFAPCVNYAVGSSPIGSDPTGIAVADFNGDGKADVVSANWSWDSKDFSVLLGNGDGTFAPRVNYPVQSDGWGPWAVAVADFNSDGNIDLVGSVGSDSPIWDVAILLGDGHGGFSAPSYFTAPAFGLAVGDFNGDGQPDIAGANPRANNLSILLNTTFIADTTPPTITITSPSPSAAYAQGQAATPVWTATDSGSGVDWSKTSATPLDTTTPGIHTFTVTATDLAGNVAHASVSYMVYATTGVAQPVNADGSSIFKFGSTVPLKFSLADALGMPIGGLAPKLYLSKFSNGIWGSDIEAVSTCAADSGNTFRETSPGGYMFNLATKGLSTGTWRLRVDLGNGAQLSVLFSLK